MNRTVKEPEDESKTTSETNPGNSRILDEGFLAQGKFVRREQIAYGSQGSIWRVQDERLLREVAMKCFSEPKRGAEELRARFIEEAQIMGQLDHPNIVPVYELGLEDHVPYFTMKLVQGDTLDDLLADPSFDPAEPRRLETILRILYTVCNAVSFAHSRGVVHRDLKPANIMVGSFGQVYVMDWGIAMLSAYARAKGERGSRPLAVSGEGYDEQGLILGTPAYMAPEQATADLERISERTDVFAIGAILYRVLTGRAPFEGKTLHECAVRSANCQFTPLEKAARAGVPKRVCDISRRAMAKDPTKRYPSVAALADELDLFLRGPPGLPLRSFEPGELVLREGDPAGTAYIIVAGVAQAFKATAAGETILREMSATEVFGEAGLLGNQPRTASVRAKSTLRVMEVTKAILNDEISTTTWVGPLVRALAARFREVDARAARQLQRTEISRMDAIYQAILRHLNFHGEDRGRLRRVGQWSPLRSWLATRFQKPEAEMTELVSQFSDLEVRLEHDEIELNGQS